MKFAGIVSGAKKAFGFPVEQKAYSLNSTEFAEAFNYRPTYSGVNVGGQQALNVPAVLQAVRLISETIGSLPVKLYRDGPNGKEEAKDHPAYKLAHSRANAEFSAGNLRELLTKNALLYGSGFGRVQRFDDGSPFEIYRIKHGCTSVYEDDITGFLEYHVSYPGGTTIFPHSDILHISTFDGVSPITHGREAIGLAAILERSAAQLFASGAKPSVIIKTQIADNDAGANKWKNIRKDFQRWQEDPREPLILPPASDIEQPVMSSTDAQFIENRVFQLDEIARAFGVPQTLLFELNRGTWSNSEQLAQQFLTLCLRPWLDRWQDAYAVCLLTEEERDTYYFEFVVDDLLRADSTARAEIFAKLIAARAMTPNEARAAMNMPPLPGGDELMNPHTISSAAPVQVPAKE